VCDEFWLVSRGGIGPFDGDLDDYQRYLLDVAKQAREAQRQEQKDQRNAPVAAAPVAAPLPAPAASRSPEQRKQDAQRRQQLTEQLRPLKKELEQNEKRTAALNADRAALEAGLAEPSTPAAMADAGRKLKAVSDEIDTLEARWLELTERIESTGSA
jgi:ATP-binding cassette subfamily F protein 3